MSVYVHAGYEEPISFFELMNVVKMQNAILFGYKVNLFYCNYFIYYFTY